MASRTDAAGDRLAPSEASASGRHGGAAASTRDRGGRARSSCSASLAGHVVTSPGWARVQETYFYWDKAVDSLPAVLPGLWLNIRVIVVCAVLIVVLGLTIAVMRTLRGPIAFPLRLLATVYVDLFRGLPLILVLLLLGFGVPALDLEGVPTSALFWAAPRWC